MGQINSAEDISKFKDEIDRQINDPETGRYSEKTRHAERVKEASKPSGGGKWWMEDF